MSVAAANGRAKNKILGRALGRSGFWRTLWR
jgi:muconolactone delta-isomerase